MYTKVSQTIDSNYVQLNKFFQLKVKIIKKMFNSLNSVVVGKLNLSRSYQTQ